MLGRRPDGEAVAVHARDDTVGLERVMGERGIPVDALDDQIRVFEGVGEIAALIGVVLADVGARDGPQPAEIAEVSGALDLRVNQARVGGERLLGAGRGRQFFVPDVDESERGLGMALGVGDDGDHGLARVADDLVGQDRLVAVGGAEVEPLHRKIGRRTHGEHARRCRGALGQRLDDARVRDRAAPDPGVGQAGQREIGDVTRGARHLVARVQPRDGAPDDGETVSGHCPLRLRSSAARHREWLRGSACSPCSGRCCRACSASPRRRWAAGSR